MILQKRRTVRMSETDATGIIYFTNLLKYSCEIFEEFLQNEMKKFKESIISSDIAFPIVDVQGSFVSQVTVGDEITVTIKEIQKNNTSLLVRTEILKEGALVAKATIVHVAISKKTKKKVPIDECEYLLHRGSCTWA